VVIGAISTCITKDLSLYCGFGGGGYICCCKNHCTYETLMIQSMLPRNRAKLYLIGVHVRVGVPLKHASGCNNAVVRRDAGQEDDVRF
jgi:hypothetical protein